MTIDIIIWLHTNTEGVEILSEHIVEYQQIFQIFRGELIILDRHDKSNRETDPVDK